AVMILFIGAGTSSYVQAQSRGDSGVNASASNKLKNKKGDQIVKGRDCTPDHGLLACTCRGTTDCHRMRSNYRCSGGTTVNDDGSQTDRGCTANP
ncbi:MAG: hypothetical protein KDK66_00420, partial [Deltaproteobacteria bacterium]|nr:hypothetical protein [Deltaproteobacteria bacterium]